MSDKPKNKGGRKGGKSRLFNLLKNKELRLKLSVIKIETASFYGNGYVRAIDPEINKFLEILFNSRGDKGWICRERLYAASILGNAQYEVVDPTSPLNFMERFFSGEADLKLYGMPRDEVLRAVEQYRRRKEKREEKKKE